MSTSNTFKSMRPNFKESFTKRMQTYMKGDVPEKEKIKIPKIAKLTTLAKTKKAKV